MEAYLKKLCFEYQVDEKEVKELLARMEMVYLDKGETIASATMPEQSLYIIVSGILHTYTTHEGEDRTIRFLSEGDAVLCYNSSQYAVKARRNVLLITSAKRRLKSCAQHLFRLPTWIFN